MSAIVDPPSLDVSTSNSGAAVGATNSTTTTPTTPVSSKKTSAAAATMDERQVARAALDAAEEQLRSLCASHAGTFVAVERRGAALSKALVELRQEISQVEPTVHQVQLQLEQDGTHSLAAISERHRVRRRTLLQHSHLLELLELPSLMDACVRSNLYEEALSIASFANTLERRHVHLQQQGTHSTTATQQQRNSDANSTHKNAAVVIRVIEQIRSRQIDLRRHLLFRLKQPVTMPQCLEVVTALRRLNGIDLEGQQQHRHHHQGGNSTAQSAKTSALFVEQQDANRLFAAMEMKLQVEFLEARDVWLDSTSTTTLPSSSLFRSSSSSLTAKRGGTTLVAPSEQLLDMIERYRTRVFEIATQFNAIFRASPTASTTGGPPKDDPSALLLSMWTHRRIHSFFDILGSSLARMEDAASLRDALESCVFFATSMGRLGADFSALLPPLYEPKLLVLIQHFWKDGIQTLSETLKVCRDAGVASPLSTAGGIASSTSSSLGQQQALDQPPRILLNLPPLGRLVNSFLQGLNEVRRCLLPGIFTNLRKELQSSLKQVRSMLETHQRAVLTPGLRGEATQLREMASQYIQMFDGTVKPYLEGALEVAIGDYRAALSFFKQGQSDSKEEDEEEKEDENEEDEGDGDGNQDFDAEDEKDESEVAETEENAATQETIETAQEIENDSVLPESSEKPGDGWDDF